MSTDPATFDVPPFPVRRLSVGEFLRMIRDDVFADAGRLELLEGWIVPRTTWDPPQAVTVELASDAIRAALPDGWHRRTRGTVTTADSVPEPALSVVRGAIRDYARAHPTGVDAALVVEFAPPAWPGDPAIKNRIYARATIPLIAVVMSTAPMMRSP